MCTCGAYGLWPKGNNSNNKSQEVIFISKISGFAPLLFCCFFFSSARTISQRSRKVIIAVIVWQEQWFMNNRMQKNPWKCINLSWSDQVLMIRSEWAAGRPTCGEAERRFGLALGAVASWRLMWKGLLTASLCPLPPYGVFWEDLWFKGASKTESTAPREESGMAFVVAACACEGRRKEAEEYEGLETSRKC